METFGYFDEFMREAEKLNPEGFARARAERAELDAMRKDAERYRKWRADYTGGESTEMLLSLADALEPAQVDAAIDAAMIVTPN